MQIVNDLTDADLAYWRDRCPDARRIVMRRPPDLDNCTDCGAIATHTDDGLVVRVGWKPDEIDVVHLARGATLWLSARDALPVFTVEVANGETTQLGLAHITRNRLSYWAEAPWVRSVQPLVIGGPPAEPDCAPVPAIATVAEDGSGYFHVGLLAGDDAVDRLARGGTVWLSTWGGLPPHSFEVQPST